MTYRIKKIVSVICLAAAICAITLLPASGYAENLRFVFMADSRGDYGTPIINTAALDAINKTIVALSPRPSFVIYGGDQAYRGCIDGKYTFDDFKTAMKRLTDAKITLYTAIGNHELYVKGATDDQGFIFTNQTAYQTAFASNPANGPAGYTPSYDHLVYSFESPGGDAFFAVLDPYFLTADVPNPDLGGTIDSNQLAWLQAQLAQTKATHKFLFIHVPYYSVFDDPIEPTPDHDATWTQLWSILDNNNFDLFCCGHTHLYSRKNINSSIAPNPQPTPPIQWKGNVFQLLCGTCGVRVSTGTPKVNPILWHVSNAADTYFFSVVDICGTQVTVNSYKGNTGAYTVFDTFTVQYPLSPVNFLLLD
ncbi:MAG: metallophosphoesterase [Deltaproteobacteria bacterium]|nr:metallophosphoesterase [Deltaproteobacteria bacterium]